MPIAMFSFSAGKVALSRHQQRAEQTLEDAEGDDQGDAAGEADRAGGRGETDHAYEEGLPVPEAVTELARGDQGDREREEVAVGDPLDVGEARAQVLLDGRVGDGHDGAVQGDHHDADGNGEQGEPRMAAQPVGRRLVRGSDRSLVPRTRRVDGGLTSHTFEASDSH
jgi:hypothetical protein